MPQDNNSTSNGNLGRSYELITSKSEETHKNIQLMREDQEILVMSIFAFQTTAEEGMFPNLSLH